MDKNMLNSKRVTYDLLIILVVEGNDMETRKQLVNEFTQGILALKKANYSQAVFYFRVALSKHKESEIAKAKCMAYLGLCEVYGGLSDKISHIKEAHRMNPLDTNILHVLAYAHLRIGERQKGLAAIVLGLKIEPENARLLSFMDQVGYRRKRVINSLNRTHKINQVLGRFFRKEQKSIDMMAILPASA
jgi:hypothetical protein